MYELTDPWAPHPIVNRHICHGGGGGDTFDAKVPQMPDYSQYIQAATNMSGKGQAWADNLVKWAGDQGINLASIAKKVGGAAGRAATSQQATSDKLMSDWQKTYSPLYGAQAADAMRMNKNLPQYENEQAGAYAADAGTAIDQMKASTLRDMEGRGISPTAASTGALDTMAGTQRALATTAAGQQGRLAARNEARGATSTAIQAGTTLPQVSQTQAGLATGNRGQQVTLPESAAATTAQLYGPGMGMYTASQAPLFQWGNTMMNGYNQQLQGYNSSLSAFKANQEAGANSPLSTIGGLAAGVAGSYFGGPIGGMAASSLFGAASGAMGGGGGTGFMASNPSAWKASGTFAAKGGAINAVPPSASPSGGRRVDDVNAMLSEGEFVMPKRTVNWYGDKFFMGLIDKADKAQGLPPQEIGPETGPAPAAMNTTPPMFRSEGART